MTEAHPLRCETCAFYFDKADHKEQIFNECHSKGEQRHAVSHAQRNIISIVGCASHSSVKHDAVLDDVIRLIQNCYKGDLQERTKMLKRIEKLRSQQKEREQR